MIPPSAPWGNYTRCGPIWRIRSIGRLWRGVGVCRYPGASKHFWSGLNPDLRFGPSNAGCWSVCFGPADFYYHPFRDCEFIAWCYNCNLGLFRLLLGRII